MKPYLAISTKQAMAILTVHGGELPTEDNGKVKLACGAILRRLPAMFRKGADKVHAPAYRLTADKPEILTPMLSIVGKSGKSVCLRYETDPAELQAAIAAATLKRTTETFLIG